MAVIADDRRKRFLADRDDNHTLSGRKKTMGKTAKTAAATSLAVLALAGAAACTGGGDSYIPNGTVVTKWSKHTTAGSQYWLQVRYSTTGNGRNLVTGVYKVSQATYNACQAGFLTISCKKG